MSFESKNPTTGEHLGTYPEHTAGEVEERLQRAWDGWKSWPVGSRRASEVPCPPSLYARSSCLPRITAWLRVVCRLSRSP